jgi:hypothetical protein
VRGAARTSPGEGEIATVGRTGRRRVLTSTLVRLDLAFADGITLTESFLKTDLGIEYDFIGPTLSDPRWFGRGEGIAVCQGNIDLLARLNGALRQIVADGTYQEIRMRYFDYDIYGDAPSLAQPLEAPVGGAPE